LRRKQRHGEGKGCPAGIVTRCQTKNSRSLHLEFVQAAATTVIQIMKPFRGLGKDLGSRRREEYAPMIAVSPAYTT
jgi:hypothetical protein